MDKNTKKVLGALGVAAAIGGIVAIANSGKAEAAPGGGGNSGGLTIKLYDSNGNLIGSSAQRSVPIGAVGAVASATEGDTISMVIGATNTSYQTLGGVQTPVAATLTLKVSGVAGAITLISQTSKAFSFGASQSLSIDKTVWGNLQFTVPVGAGGSTGVISASLVDPNGNVLATGQSSSFSIAAAPIHYGGTISFV